MVEETGYFSSFDGTKLFYRAYVTDAPASIILIHGFGEHSGRFREFIAFLKKLPISIYTFDLRGHGRSEGARVFVNSFEDYVQDVYAFRDFIHTERKKISNQIFLFGRSLGALIGTAVVLKNQLCWRALLTVSPFFGFVSVDRGLIYITKFLDLIIPHKIWNNPLKPKLLTHDAVELDEYKKDNLVQRRITMRLAHEMFKGCIKYRKQAAKIEIPVLILGSGNDRIVSLKEEKKFFENLSSKDKKMRIFSGAYHELLHEEMRQEAFEEVATFLRRNLLTQV